MVPDQANIRVDIFQNPTLAEKKRAHPNHIILSDTELADAELPRRIYTSLEEDLLFIPLTHDLIPDEIDTPFGKKKLANDYRKFWKRANIVTISGDNPRESFRQRMGFVHANDYLRAYSWKPPEGSRVYTPLTAIIDGRILYFTIATVFPALGLRDKIEVDEYGSDAVVKLPSRSLEEVKRYTIGFKDLPTPSSGVSWQRTIIEHACEDKEYKIKANGYFVDDHAIAAETAVELYKAQTADPIANSPFVIPSRELVFFYRKLVGQVVKLYLPEGASRQAERNLTEAERELLLWKFIGLVNNDTIPRGRSYERLFVDTYDRVEEYLVPKMQV